MEIECDPDKRAQTLATRGVDLLDAKIDFEGPSLTFSDDRHDYGEERFITIGRLKDRMMIVV